MCWTLDVDFCLLSHHLRLESGLMIVQYVAGSSLLNFTVKQLLAAFSTSTSAGQEDHVSMGATSAWNLVKGVERLSEVLACELLIACEALEHASLSTSAHVQGLYDLVRTLSPPLTGDRSTSTELRLLSEALRKGGWLARLEAEFGRLPR